MRALHGLDRPFLERYLAWASGLVRGEFGYSRLFAQPVASLLGPALLSTLALAGTALLIALGLGVALGALAASRPRAAPLVDAIAVPADRILAIPASARTGGLWGVTKTLTTADAVDPRILLLFLVQVGVVAIRVPSLT